MYAPLLLFTSLFAASLWTYLEEGRRRWLVLAGAAGVLASWTFTYGFLLPGFGCVWALLRMIHARGHDPRARAAFALSALAGLSILPWLWAVREAVEQGQFLSQGGRGRGGWIETTAYCFYTLGFGLTSGIPMDELRQGRWAALAAQPAQAAAMGLGLWALIVTMAGGLWGLWKAQRRWFDPAAAGLLVLAGGPALMDGATERILNNPRYGIMALPMVALALGGLAAAPAPAWMRRTGWTACAAVLMLGVWSLYNNYAEPRYQRDDFKGAAAWIARHPGQPGAVVVCAGNLAGVYRIYDASRTVIGIADDTPDAMEKNKTWVRQLAREHRSFAVVLSRLDYGDRQGRIVAWLSEEFLSVDRRDFPGLEVRIMKKRMP